MTDQEQKESEVNQPTPAPEKRPQGFAVIDKDRQREIAASGGIASHELGRGHEWTSEEARDAAYRAAETKRRKRAERERKAKETDT